MNESNHIPPPLADHLAFCRESERISQQELDKLKIGLPTILLGVLTFLSSSTEASGLWIKIFIATTCLTVVLTATSFAAAAAANRGACCTVYKECKLPIDETLTPSEVWLAKNLVMFNNLSFLSTIAAVIALGGCLWTLS